MIKYLYRAKFIILLTVIIVGPLVAGSSVFAVSATLTQKILPLNCIFTTVNAGTGELYYFTPEACGQYVAQPPAVAQQAEPSAGKSYSYIPPATTNSGEEENPPSSPTFPWAPIVANTPNQPFTNVRLSSNSHANLIITAAGLALVVILATIIIFVI